VAIELLLPHAVVAVELREDPQDAEDELFPEELAAIRDAVAKRRREFASGRVCARRALGRLGIAPRAIPRGASGEPVWPGGVVGSITHCAGYRACAVARSCEIAAVGIDAGRNAALPDGVWERVAFGAERQRGRQVAGVCVDALLFSAKESVYKAWFPLAGRWLGFEQAVVTIELHEGASEGALSVELLTEGPLLDGVPLSRLTGRWRCEGELLLTAVVVTRAPPSLP
jgi:4'-phosphopantetheinyl transferase EntD